MRLMFLDRDADAKASKPPQELRWSRGFGLYWHQIHSLRRNPWGSFGRLGSFADKDPNPGQDQGQRYFCPAHGRAGAEKSRNRPVCHLFFQ
jgi:hypothetical protein